MKISLTKLSVVAAALWGALFGSFQARAAVGDLYVGGLSDNVVYRFTPAGARSVFASGVNADAIAFDSRGNLFASDTANKVIVKIAPNGTVTPFASGQNGENFVPGGLAFDPAGNLYAASTSNGNIYRYTPSGARTTVASGINTPSGLAFDRGGNLYVAEFGTGSILKFNGTSGPPSPFFSGLVAPEGLAFDTAGNLYVAEFGAGRISKITPTGSSSTPFAFSLIQPGQLTFDSNDNLFVSTIGDRKITKIAPNGAQTPFAVSINAGGLAFETPSGILANISTRASVQTGDQVTIAGFIVTGSVSKSVLVRGLGPTLGTLGVSGALQDPTLDLRNSTQSLVTNDDWQTASNSGSIPQNLRPPDPRESAILATLQPGNYTAILAGKNSTTGVGLVDVYDLDTASDVSLTNVSTRGFVGTGDAVMIGGFITSGGNGLTRVLIRALGPTLATFGVSGVLADPFLQLVDGNGNTLATNNNWQDSQAAAIAATGYAPPDSLEAAILATLIPGNYTAVLSGNGGGTGVALVEVYNVH